MQKCRSIQQQSNSTKDKRRSCSRTHNPLTHLLPRSSISSDQLGTALSSALRTTLSTYHGFASCLSKHQPPRTHTKSPTPPRSSPFLLLAKELPYLASTSLVVIRQPGQPEAFQKLIEQAMIENKTAAKDCKKSL